MHQSDHEAEPCDRRWEQAREQDQRGHAAESDRETEAVRERHYMDELEECDHTRIAPALLSRVSERPRSPRFDPADSHEGGHGHIRRRSKNAAATNEPDQKQYGDRKEAVLQAIHEPSDRNAGSVVSRPVNYLLRRERRESLLLVPAGSTKLAAKLTSRRTPARRPISGLRPSSHSATRRRYIGRHGCCRDIQWPEQTERRSGTRIPQPTS